MSAPISTVDAVTLNGAHPDSEQDDCPATRRPPRGNSGRAAEGDGGAGIRGRTTLADRAVERIAAKAVSEVEGVGGSARRMLGVVVGGADPDRAAEVSAEVRGETVSLRVRLSVLYPVSVAGTTEQVRTHLRRRVEELTGLPVPRVDITVTALHRDAVGGRVR